MKETVVVIAISVVGLAGLMWWGSSTEQIAASGAAPQGTLTAPEKFYDFGTISMKDGDVTKDFTVINSSDKDVFVPTLITSCMCTSAFIVEPDGTVKGPFKMPGMGYVPRANETIKAGESRLIRVVYDPNAHGPAGVGPIDRIATLTDA